jgi:tRNA(Ile2) C34 agmatinyltransferase TiaS
MLLNTVHTPCPVCRKLAIQFQTTHRGADKIRCPSCGLEVRQNQDGLYEHRKLNGRRETRRQGRGKYLMMQPREGAGRTLRKIRDGVYA